MGGVKVVRIVIIVVLASLSFATDSTYVSAVVVKAGDNGSRRWSYRAPASSRGRP